MKFQQFSIAILATLFTAAPAFAEIDVKITSFQMLERGPKVLWIAELCGAVTGAPENAVTAAKIVVDYKTNKPATYNQLAAEDGKFCSVVVTYTGLAEVTGRVVGTVQVSQTREFAAIGKETYGETKPIHPLER